MDLPEPFVPWHINYTNNGWLGVRYGFLTDKEKLYRTRCSRVRYNFSESWSDIAFTLLVDPIQDIVGWSHGTIWGLRLDKQIGVHNITEWWERFVLLSPFIPQFHLSQKNSSEAIVNCAKSEIILRSALSFCCFQEQVILNVPKLCILSALS
jgi:hypothetical protein